MVENIELYDMSSMICSEIKAFVMARRLESVVRTSYDTAHTDDVHCGLWTVGGMLRYGGTRHWHDAGPHR